MDINVRKHFLIILFSILFCLICTVQVHGAAIDVNKPVYLIPGGETIGIELSTSVVVADTYTVKTTSGATVNPAKEAGIVPGDIILYIDGNNINKIEDVRNELIKYKDGRNEPMKVIIRRNSKMLNKTMHPVRTRDNLITLGMYLRDNIMGIGTLTFIYGDSYFGALGHQIQDKDIPDIEMYKANGIIKKAEVTHISKSYKGTPGEKHAVFSSKNLGTITDNTLTGIYGKLTDDRIEDKRKMKAVLQKDVKLGDAQILTVINDSKIEAFDVKIIDLVAQDEKDIKGIKLQITDKRLLNQTGGIIQGMSGSPIIQNNCIVGAVTHVLVDDTTIGYGVYIEFMLEDLGISIHD